MPAPIQTLLNPQLGIQDLLQMPEPSRLPQARDLPSSVLNRSGLEGLYGADNARSGAESLLCPDVGDGSIVSPEVYEAQIAAVLAKLQQSENPKIRAMLENEILPLMQNGMLLQAYRGLMLGG